MPSFLLRKATIAYAIVSADHAAGLAFLAPNKGEAATQSFLRKGEASTQSFPQIGTFDIMAQDNSLMGKLQKKLQKFWKNHLPCWVRKYFVPKCALDQEEEEAVRKADMKTAKAELVAKANSMLKAEAASAARKQEEQKHQELTNKKITQTRNMRKAFRDYEDPAHRDWAQQQLAAAALSAVEDTLPAATVNPQIEYPPPTCTLDPSSSISPHIEHAALSSISFVSERSNSEGVSVQSIDEVAKPENPTTPPSPDATPAVTPEGIPLDEDTAPPPPPIAMAWTRQYDDSKGIYYYYNLVTEESVLERPAEMQDHDGAPKWSFRPYCP